MKVPYISTRKREWLQTLQNCYGSANVLLGVRQLHLIGMVEITKASM